MRCSVLVTPVASQLRLPDAMGSYRPACHRSLGSSGTALFDTNSHPPIRDTAWTMASRWSEFRVKGGRCRRGAFRQRYGRRGDATATDRSAARASHPRPIRAPMNTASAPAWLPSPAGPGFGASNRGSSPSSHRSRWLVDETPPARTDTRFRTDARRESIAVG